MTYPAVVYSFWWVWFCLFYMHSMTDRLSNWMADSVKTMTMMSILLSKESPESIPALFSYLSTQKTGWTRTWCAEELGLVSSKSLPTSCSLLRECASLRQSLQPIFTGYRFFYPEWNTIVCGNLPLFQEKSSRFAARTYISEYTKNIPMTLSSWQWTKCCFQLLTYVPDPHNTFNLATIIHRTYLPSLWNCLDCSVTTTAYWAILNKRLIIKYSPICYLLSLLLDLTTSDTSALRDRVNAVTASMCTSGVQTMYGI